MMRGANPSQEQFARMIKNEGDQCRGTNVSKSYPDTASQWITHCINLICPSICVAFSNLTGNGTATSNCSRECSRHVRYDCLPYLTIGRRELAKKRVKSIVYFFVPLILLFFFLNEDADYVNMKNVPLRRALHTGVYTNWESGQVKDLHFHSLTLSVRQNLQREFLERRPDRFMDVNGHVTTMCPRGILFLFHGCNRYSASFYYSPQGRRLISSALERGFVTVAVKKKEELGCWSWKDDAETVLKLGKKFLETRYQDECRNNRGETVYPPVFGFGASSGGQFVGQLASEMKKNGKAYFPFTFSAVNIQIMAPSAKWDFDIPAIYTVMKEDKPTMREVEAVVSNNSQSKMIVTSGRKPILSDHYFNVFDDDPQMSDFLSNSIHTDLIKMNVVDAETNLLLGDPRHSRDAVAAIPSICEKYNSMARTKRAKEKNDGDAEEAKPFGMSLGLLGGLTGEESSDAECIWLIEELNVAWDKHEITAEGFDGVLAFFLESVIIPHR
ncbi:hypothetical protein ACHAXS_010878 [Conticribra weissflogii]